jgi:DNA-binding FadR family transcriptional regulator
MRRRRDDVVVTSTLGTPTPAPAPRAAVIAPGPAHPVFRRIRGGNAFEETVERLLQSVKLGIVQPGERLPTERELAVRLGVSRVTLREAIRALAQEGYLESRRGRTGGTFVLPPDARRPDRRNARTIVADMGPELHDALVLRQVLEPGAAEFAARRRLGVEDRRLLEDLLEQCSCAGPEGYRPLDSRLHIAIAELTGSSSLAAAVADVRMRLNDLLDSIPLLPRNIEHSNDQHRRIVRAIVGGKPADARRAMQRHIDGTAALLRAFLA